MPAATIFLRKDLFGYRRASQDVAPLEHEGLPPRARQIGRGHESVVPSPDDDRVVARGHAFFLSGSKKGSFRTTALARRRWCSTVISSSTRVPGVK